MDTIKDQISQNSRIKKIEQQSLVIENNNNTLEDDRRENIYQCVIYS